VYIYTHTHTHTFASGGSVAGTDTAVVSGTGARVRPLEESRAACNVGCDVRNVNPKSHAVLSLHVEDA